MDTKKKVQGHDFSLGKLPCPDCNVPIPMDLRRMFAGEPATCSNCGVVLRLNLEESRETIRAIKDAQTTISKATGGQIKPF